jgi:hypothetical protein
MKPTFSDLTKEQQKVYGNGCGLRFLPVPDFNFTASCRQHDFNFERGSEIWYKAPYYYFKANWDFYTHMIDSSIEGYQHVAALVYFITVTLISWPFFTVGKWKTVEEIVERDKRSKRML